MYTSLVILDFSCLASPTVITDILIFIIYSCSLLVYLNMYYKFISKFINIKYEINKTFIYVSKSTEKMILFNYLSRIL